MDSRHVRLVQLRKAWTWWKGFHESCVQLRICCIPLCWMKSASHQRFDRSLKDLGSEARSMSLLIFRMISAACRAIWRRRSSASFKKLLRMSTGTRAVPLREFGLQIKRGAFSLRLQITAREYRLRNGRLWKLEPRWELE